MMRRFRAKCQFQMSVLSVNVSSMSPGTDMRKLLSRLTNRVFLKKCQKCQVICSIDILSFRRKIHCMTITSVHSFALYPTFYLTKLTFAL